MKLRNLWLGTAAIVALAGTNAFGQIGISRHNFSSYGWSGGEICKPCHTPHFATMAFPLWNHDLTNATYTMHEGEGTAAANIDSRSRMCLGCHDGTVALDSFGGATGTNFIGPLGNVGIDLTDDHPIGSDAIYPTAASTSFNPQDASHRVGGLRLRSWINPSGVEEYVVGCSTCHAVHNTGNYGHMLRMSNASSALCLTCHIK
ncbi:hypothetical protein PHYC_00718 [Phycisphaerales bacterium]|nr:hypothetical protein PHYC_00718 [Phycisphaerales bacterium]